MAMKSASLRTVGLTSIALLAFAANSVLMRLALVADAMDASSFTTVRLAGGALVLALLVTMRRRRRPGVVAVRDLPSALLLALYAVPVTFAYRSLSTGTGALLLFAAVQASMIGVGFWRGERPRTMAWVGIAVAIGGLVLLVAPGLEAPPPGASAVMALAGIAWGLYSLRGRRSTDPVAAAASSFAWAVPVSALVSLVLLPGINASPRGLVLAGVSGMVTSGLGYVVWFAALRGLTAVQAATVQLTVPVLAVGGGVVFLAESVSLRLAFATVAILGGVGVSIVAGRNRDRSPRPSAVAVPARVSLTAQLQSTPSTHAIELGDAARRIA